MNSLRTVVTFQSTAFNTSERRPYFINDGCFGDDVARWLIAELYAHGIPTDAEPGQEDFGWFFGFRPADVVHQFIIGYRPTSAKEPGVWIGWVERKRGLLGSLLGARNRGIQVQALQAIHAVLSRADRVAAVRWHRRADFDAGHEEAGTPQPG